MKTLFACAVVALLTGVSLQVWGDITGLRFTPMAKTSDEDLVIYNDVLEDALNHTPDGEVRRWENSHMDTHGALIPVKSGEIDGTFCRLLEINNRAAQLTGRYHFYFCKHEKGVWVIMPAIEKRAANGE